LNSLKSDLRYVSGQSTVPPQKTGYLDIPFPGRSRESDERSSNNAHGVHRPVSPGDHFVGSHDMVIDPMNSAARFNV